MFYRQHFGYDGLKKLVGDTLFICSFDFLPEAENRWVSDEVCIHKTEH